MNLSDKDLLSSGLFAVKHMTMIYNELACQTDDHQLARELCDMISEEHNARIRLFETMRQRGWYNPQMIDDQQLRQTQQKIQQQIQQQIQQPGAGQYQQTSYQQTAYQSGWQQAGPYQTGSQIQPQFNPQITNAQTQAGYASGRSVQ